MTESPLAENLRRVLAAVELELQLNASSRQRLVELQAILMADLEDLEDGAPLDEPPPVVEPEPVFTDPGELRRLATHRALTLLRAGEKETVQMALDAVGGSRVSELSDEQVVGFLKVVEG